MRTITYYEDLTEHNLDAHSHAPAPHQPAWYKVWKPADQCPVCGAQAQHIEKTETVKEEDRGFVRIKSDIDKAI